MSSSKSRVFKLRCWNNEIFEVEEEVAVLSEVIKTMAEGSCEGDEIPNTEEYPLPSVHVEILGMVVEWCKKHAKGKETEEKLQEWDAEFLDVDEGRLFHLFLAADYLEIKELLAQVAQKVADMIKGKTSEEVRQVFKIKNDMDPEVVKKVREQNPWSHIE